MEASCRISRGFMVMTRKWQEFVNGWEKDILMAFGVEFRIHETFIVEISNLQMEGKLFYR